MHHQKQQDSHGDLTIKTPKMGIGAGAIIKGFFEEISTESQRHFAFCCGPGIDSYMARYRKKSLLLRGLAILILLLTAGCGTIKIAYDYADWWVEYKLEQWVDLDSDQEQALQAGLDPYFKWHKSTIMPRIADAASALAQAAAKGQCATLFDKQQNLWNGLYQDTVKKMTPIIAGVLTTLDAEQHEELAEGMQEDLEKAYKRMKSPEERTEKFISRMEGFLGDLTDKQREFLSWKDPIAQKHEDLRMSCRVTHQKKLMQALRTKQSIPEVEAILNGWWTQDGCSPAYLKHRNAMRQSWRTRMTEFEKSLDPDQRESLVEELTTFKNNIRSILN